MTARGAGLQAINLPLADGGTYTNQTLNAAFVGNPDTSCLRFNAAGSLPTNFFAELGTLAANGTVVSISDPGVYDVELVTSQVGAVTNVWGLSLGAVASPLTAVPAFGTDGCFMRAQQVSLAGQTISNVLAGIAILRTVVAKATAGLTAANNIRGLAAATGGGAPTGLVAANVSLRITKMNFTSI